VLLLVSDLRQELAHGVIAVLSIVVDEHPQLVKGRDHVGLDQLNYEDAQDARDQDDQTDHEVEEELHVRVKVPGQHHHVRGLLLNLLSDERQHQVDVLPSLELALFLPWSDDSKG